MRDEGTPAALARACGLARRQQWPPRSSAALWSASAARHRSLACSGRYRPPPGHANCITRCPLPAHPTALGDQLQMPVALGRRGLCRCAWHRARTWWHNDRRIRMTLTDLTVDIVPIVRPIAGKRRNRARNLLQQGTDLRAVIDILAGQLGGNDLSRVGVHPDMELSPGPTHLCGVLLDQPLTGTAELERSAVHQQVDRFAAWSWSRHRQCLAPSADRRMVGRCEIKIKQSGEAPGGKPPATSAPW